MGAESPTVTCRFTNPAGESALLPSERETQIQVCLFFLFGDPALSAGWWLNQSRCVVHFSLDLSLSFRFENRNLSENTGVIWIMWFKFATDSRSLSKTKLQLRNIFTQTRAPRPILSEKHFFFFLVSAVDGLDLHFSPAPLLFCPAYGASSCCCCPPALCSCSNEGPLQAASRSRSRSPECNGGQKARGG